MTSFSTYKQRGIYSEVINPENAQSFGNEILNGPDKSLLIKVNQKQGNPKAMEIFKKKDGAARRPTIKKIFKIHREIETVDPKVMEPYDPIPGRVPRKVAIDRKKKEYASYDIESLLLAEGIDYNDPKKHVEWLPLELFDDEVYDDFSNQEWINKATSEEPLFHALTGKGLYKNQENVFEWRPILIKDFIPEKEKYLSQWQDDVILGANINEFLISRINFVLDAEDPRKFAKRVQKAHQQRIFADAQIRFNYYIDNMPTQDLNDLDAEQRKRLEMLAKTKKLENMEFTSLLMEVNNDYARTMNKIIFEKFLEQNEEEMNNLDLFPIQLELPPHQQEKETPYYGMMQLQRNLGGLESKEKYIINNSQPQYNEPKDFTEIFKDFCFASLYIKEEVIKALQEIRLECNKVLTMSMFNFDKLPSQMKLEAFKYIQESANSQILYLLKDSWVKELIKIIKGEFADVGKGWFNMKETSKITYDFGKLKRFLIVVRLMMQDTLLSLVKKCFFEYYEFFNSYIPSKVIINSSCSVENHYSEDYVYVRDLKINVIGENFLSRAEVQSTEPLDQEAHEKKWNKKPLFNIDLLKTLTDEEFVYSTNPEDFIHTMLQIQQKALDEVAKIPDLEPLILSDLYKSQKNNKNFIKSPMKPREEPKPRSNEGEKSVQDENKWVWDLFESTKMKLQQGIEPLQRYLKQFDQYLDILHLNPDEYVRNIEMEENQREVDQIKEEIFQVRKKEQELKTLIPEEIHVSFFNIQCKDLLGYLCSKYETLGKNLTELIAKRFRLSNQKLMNEFEVIKSKIKEQPNDIEKLTDIKEYMQNLPAELEKIKLEINKSTDIYKILEGFNYRFTKEDMNKRWNIFGGPKETIQLMDNRKSALEKEKVKFLETMKSSQEDFKSTIENLERTVQNFHQHQNIKDHENIARDVESVNQQLIQYKEDARKYNMHEALFDLETTDYSKIQQMERDFQPYSNLWLTSSKWLKSNVSWLNDDWESLDAISAEKFIEDGSKTLTGVIRYFKERDMLNVYKIAETIKGQIDEFKPKVPLMVALRKDGMKDRHWQQISQKVGFDVKPTEGFNFQAVLDLGLMKNVEQCCEIGEKASKEFHIENMLNDMWSQWEKINFSLLPHKGTHIIRGYDDIQAVLDEHIVNTQGMQFSPFKKPFEEDILTWNSQLKLMSDILEEWAKCQGQWMYLQPIFDSPDIAKQLPQETKKFKTVDSTWKHTMTQARGLQNVLRVCTTTEGLLERLQEANKNLELIQKELNNYLEKKREKFARFYFLSNDDLLEILSQTKEPTAVQPHLKKVFENINQVEFDNKKLIHAMYSEEGEKVNFVKPVDPNNKNVEDWMGEVEEMMKRSVRHALLNSVKEYPNPQRTMWVRQHPGQCVLNGSQVHWTSEVEQAIKAHTVPEYLELSQAQLLDLVELVRQKLNKMQKVTLNALIVIDVHAKDVVEKLVKANVNDISAFEWISQLRYYIENENCFVKCIQTRFPYGCEYLGNTLRLVITPLTDKCYMTLMGALNLNLGGAPAGPAGTGKTESTKDLAKALAKQCVVFNCSDQMDYIMVGKFFKGLASSGAWCCFDEFNRINIEVLSVIAQQLQTLFTEKAKGTPKIEFEGSDIKIQPTFSVFITMNPGYAGRTELPDNLKALFRAVAMMVPDYALIGEIMLYSFGFKQGRDLARKMVATFKLSSEQLSTQDHYDYGMRAVRSVINAAGLLKSNEPDMDEEKLLLRALRDVNVPKFLKDDLPLFENIILDLFPGVEKPNIDLGNLLDAIKEQCKNLELQAEQVFLNKINQLYDTCQVRHGLMLVGPTGGGKTKNYNVLQKALSQLHDDGFYKVHLHVLNPKSIKMGQLYGEFNEQTHEWFDGILAYMIRECVKDQSSEKHWVIFDGPVDSLWIESMNTVLDDNKKLCLNSGQILQLTPHMTMMFEVEDLAVASPATVSRCGMVYMEPGAMGYQPLIDSWLEFKLPETLRNRKSFINYLKMLFQDYIEPVLNYLKKDLKEIIPTMNNNLLSSLMNIMNCYLEDYRETEIKQVNIEEIEHLETIIEPLFLFSLIWSLCCTVDSDGKEKLDIFLRNLMKEKNSKWSLPEKIEDQKESVSIYDFKFNFEKSQFEPWSELFKNFEVDPKSQYHEVMVPTNDSTRNIYLKELLIKKKFHVLCPGPTGTGKSQNIFTLLINKMGEEYQYISITFSAQTGANQTQDSIDSRMEKRRKGYFGPPIGKRCVIFVDDLNMPKKETYGAQPPLEVLRQYLDHKGWYNRKDQQFMHLEDLILLSAMGPPGGGRTQISSRLVRHFNILAYSELDDPTTKRIFNTLAQFFLKKFSDTVKENINLIVESVVELYKLIKQTMLPTPSKSHYTFNMRDIWRVFQGICSASNKYCSDKDDLIRIWYHENLRVFYDRLTTEEDRNETKRILKEMIGSKFKANQEEVLNQERILFGDFWHGLEIEPRHYQQIPDLQFLLNKMERFQDEFNSDSHFSGGSKKQMRLVMFLDACEHICRIARILRQPQGNSLLLGIGGSGRQSLSKMATFICSYRLFQIEVIKNYNMKSWREDIKKVLLMAGIENKPVTFLFVDTQIINEQMLEDINNILNSGDVTNIYNEKDMEEIIGACKGDCIKKQLQPNKMNIFTQYLIRVKKNIHVVIAMSPLGDVFTTRLRMFPSLISCCTIDWFTEWPDEALLGVGKGAIIEYETDLGIEGCTDNLVLMFKNIHKSVEKISINYLKELRRYNYVTPTSFLEQLTLFRIFLLEKRTDLQMQLNRLKSGLDKLNEANKAVEEMREQLKVMQPQLEKTSIETEKTMERLKVDKEAADIQQKKVAKEEAIANKQQEEATRLANEAEASVADANIKLSETLKEVQKLKKDHLVEIKSFTNPSPVIRVVLQGVVLLCQDVIKSKGGNIVMKNVQGQIGQKEEDFFETAKKYLLNDPKDLLEILKNYDKNSIKAHTIDKLAKQCYTDPQFSLERAVNSSYAIQFLFNWVQAMYDYYDVYTKTQPLRDQLEEMRIIVEEKTAELKIKKEELDEINSKIRELEENYKEKIILKENLTREIQECEIKKERAEKLTDGLKEEKERWGNDIAKLASNFALLPGNSLIAAGMVSYAGAFTSNYRIELEQTWVDMLDELEIPHTEGIKMTNFLGDGVKIQMWNIAGLPKDDTSIENGIIIDKSRRWPLMIDPQSQANKFIKNMGKDHEESIDILKTSDANLMRTIELAIQFGKWVLLENVGLSLDPSLEPILLQQVVKSGSSMSIIIGDKQTSYNDHFKFFMTTTIPNPHYSPETSVKVTIINFAITPKGLEEQMLALIVGLENPNLEQKKIEIVRKNAADKKELLNIEDSILKSLSDTKDISEILMDETMITKLQTSKKFAAEINQRVKDSKITEEQIDKAREGYRPVAFRASLLFFCILDLSSIDPMYQYSLQFFNNLFVMGVENSPASNELQQRLENLNNYFTYSLYENVCRSLFEKHKLLFSFILAVKILQGYDQINEKEWRYLLAGPSGEIKIPPNPTQWISENSWPEIYMQIFGSNQLEGIEGIEQDFMKNSDNFKEIFDSSNPQDIQWPEPWESKLSLFQKMILLKSIRPDKVIPAIQNWISAQIGKQFIIPPPFEFSKCFKDSTVITPLIIVLSPGSDPVADFLRFAEDQGMGKRIDSISLGQGQGQRAEAMIRSGQQRGGWVLLQNCHLAISWMIDLERICEELNENIHKDFRLWMTSMATPSFPISVLQNGVKMTIEPPKGLRDNLMRTYLAMDDKELEDCKKPDIFKKLLFGFCLFHAIILGRRKFGPIGWNIAYDFTYEDLTVCKKQLKMLLDEYDEVPYKVINFLGSEINYGGRVTDDKDVRLIVTILKTYICHDALRDGYKYSQSGLYESIAVGTIQDYLNYIQELPINPSPEAFGMHDNADITNAQNETRLILETILSIQPRSSSSEGKSREEIIEEIANNVQQRTPKPFDEEAIFKKYPTDYKESMNTVLVQEVIRYNKLLLIMQSSLINVKKALKGMIVMSEELELLANGLFDNQVPKLWSDVGFLSLKPLASWTDDLLHRIKFLQDWIDKGTPQIFWISGFFFPQAFITGTLQNYARKYIIAIDKLSFDYKILDHLSYTDITEKPEDGCYIYGMFLEGARWDYKKHIVNVSKPKELFSDLPLLHLVPIENRENPTEGIYDCPLYKVVSRMGTLSTTGHSTNFVIYIELPSREQQDIWIKAGVAAFLSLRY